MRVGVVHAYPPPHRELDARLDMARKAYREDWIDYIIVTGGRGSVDGKEYDSPRKMRQYLNDHGVPWKRILCQEIRDDEVGTPANTVDTADEVEVALDFISKNEWDNAIIRPISNWLHLKRIRVIYWARARKRGMRLNLQPLPTPNHLGLMWAIMEVCLLWPYTVLDPGWRGWFAERMRRSRRQGSKPG